MHKGGRKNGRKMMHGVMKAKRINIGETKTGKILCEINPEAQRKRQNVADRSLNQRSTILNTLVTNSLRSEKEIGNLWSCTCVRYRWVFQ